jgi:c-di-GMP-binding flagellar brake protein YcgR
VSAFTSRRRYPRFTVQGLQTTMVLTSEVEVINLSLGGIALRASRRLDIGSEYALTLDVDERQLRLNGTVVWSVLSDIVQRSGESVTYYSAGLRFDDVLSDKVRGLMEFIDRNKVAAEHRLSGIRFTIKADGAALLDGPESYAVRLISLGGMLIETDRELGIDETYAMEINPPDMEPITFTGRVASQLEVDDDDSGTSHQIGIEFLEMSEEGRQRLQQFVDTLSTG